MEERKYVVAGKDRGIDENMEDSNECLKQWKRGKYTEAGRQKDRSRMCKTVTSV